MKLWVKTSYLYGIIVKVLACLGEIYNYSLSKNCVGVVKRSWSQSHFGKLGSYYSERQPLFFTSVICIIVQNLIIKLFEKINGLLDWFVRTLFGFKDFPEFISNKQIKYRLAGIGFIFVMGVGLFTNSKMLLLAGIAAIFCVWIFLADYNMAVYVLALYALIDFIFRQYISSIASIWDELFLIGMFCVWIYKGLRSRDKINHKQTPLNIPVWCFIGIYVVLLLFSPNFSISLEGLRAIIQYMLYFFVTLQLLKNEKSAKLVLVIFASMAGCLAIYGVYQYFADVEMLGDWVAGSENIRTRVYSIFTSPNIFGSLNVLAFPISFSLARTCEKKREQIFFYFLTIMMLCSLVFTYSRGAWIGAACAVGLYVLLKNRKLIIPAIILGILILILVPSIGDRFFFMFSSDYLSSSMKGGRLIRWLTALDILKEHPLVGLGLGQFGGAVAINNGLSAIVHGQVVETYYMDNYYLKIAVEAGLIGLLAFLWLMYQVVAVSIKTIGITTDIKMKELEIGILAGLVGVICHNFVENVFEVPLMAAMFWMLAAVMMQMWLVNYKKGRKESNVKN